MKFPLFALALSFAAVFLSLGGCGGDEPEKAPAGNAQTRPNAVPEGGLKVTTWNLHNFPGRERGSASEAKRSAHFEKVIGVLKELNPDVLCVQEVRDPAALTRLANAFPGNYSVQVVSVFGRKLEVAILSRHTAEAAFWEEFEEAEADPPRGFAFAAFPFGDHMLGVYTVHLKSNVGGVTETTPKREESTRQLAKHAADMGRLYAKQGKSLTLLICGDLNHDPGRDDWKDDDTLRILEEAGFTWAGEGLPREETVTWLSDGRYPDAAFDHFLYKASDGVKVGKAEAAKTGRGVSDHRPLTVTLKLNP